MDTHLFNGSARERTARIVGKAHGAIDKVQPAVDRASRRAHALVDKAGYAASDAAESVVRSTRAVTHAPGRALGYCRGQVRDHPLAAVGIALLAGATLFGIWQLRRTIAESDLEVG
jgi:hypothetical protein